MIMNIAILWRVIPCSWHPSLGKIQYGSICTIQGRQIPLGIHIVCPFIMLFSLENNNNSGKM